MKKIRYVSRQLAWIVQSEIIEISNEEFMMLENEEMDPTDLWGLHKNPSISYIHCDEFDAEYEEVAS